MEVRERESEESEKGKRKEDEKNVLCFEKV